MRWHKTSGVGGGLGLVASNKEQHLVNEGVRETSNGTAYLGAPETAGAIDLTG
jgi:hypothetical protein